MNKKFALQRSLGKAYGTALLRVRKSTLRDTAARLDVVMGIIIQILQKGMDWTGLDHRAKEDDLESSKLAFEIL